jgi:uncharacterized protein
MQIIKPTFEAQKAFIRFIQSDKIPELENTKPENLKYYRDLVRNIFTDTLSTGLPITNRILSDEEWNYAVDTFMDQYTCPSPYVWRMPYDFYEFVHMNDLGGRLNKPWLEDLVYFEWLELEVHTMPDMDIPKLNVIDSNIKLGGAFFEKHKVFLNPYYKVLTLEYPVHNKGHLEYEANKGNYQILVYRNIQKFSVHFMELSPLFSLMIENKQGKLIHVPEQIEQTLKMLGVDQKVNLNDILIGSLPFLNDLIQKGFIIGYK